jgi:hypothetical protein
MQGIPGLAEGMLASQERLCFMQLFTYNLSRDISTQPGTERVKTVPISEIFQSFL